MSMTYELQAPLRQEQLRALAFFANTYGLQKFRLDEKKNWLHFEYDASRLKETEVEHVLRMAKIPVVGRVNANYGFDGREQRNARKKRGHRLGSAAPKAAFRDPA